MRHACEQGAEWPLASLRSIQRGAGGEILLAQVRLPFSTPAADGTVGSGTGAVVCRTPLGCVRRFRLRARACAGNCRGDTRGPHAQLATQTGSPLLVIPTVVHTPGVGYVGGGKILGEISGWIARTGRGAAELPRRLDATRLAPVRRCDQRHRDDVCKQAAPA